MKAVETEYANAVFVSEGLQPLPGAKFICEDGTPGIETCWELSDEEVQEIVQNKKVFVYMMGKTVPPMFVAVESVIEIKEKDDDHESER